MSILRLEYWWIIIQIPMMFLVGHSTMIFDIEVEITEDFQILKKDNRITIIGFNNPLTDEYFCYVLDTNKIKFRYKK